MLNNNEAMLIERLTKILNQYLSINVSDLTSLETNVLRIACDALSLKSITNEYHEIVKYESTK